MKNKITTALDKIVAEDTLKESTKLYLQSKMVKEKKVFSFTFKKFATAFACLFFIVIASTFTAYFSVTSSISIDINPSFEVGVNFLDRVVKVTAYNDDAKNATKALKLNNMKYLDAINAIMSSNDLKEYIKDDSFISVSVTANNNTKSSEMVDCISTKSSNNKSLHCYEVNSSLSKEAHKEGLSFGKYRAYIELVALNPDIKIEDIKNLSMRKIQDMIECEKGNSPTINSDNKETSSEKPCNDNSSNSGNSSDNKNHDKNQDDKENHNGQGKNANQASQSNTNSAQNDDIPPTQNSNQQSNSKPFNGNGNLNGNTNSDNKTETNSNPSSENTGESGATNGNGNGSGNGNGYGNGNGNGNSGIGKNGNGNNKNNS